MKVLQCSFTPSTLCSLSSLLLTPPYVDPFYKLFLYP
jgi:hypothetical protein